MLVPGSRASRLYLLSAGTGLVLAWRVSAVIALALVLVAWGATEKIDAIVAELKEMTDATLEVSQAASAQVETAFTAINAVTAALAQSLHTEVEQRALGDPARRAEHVVRTLRTLTETPARSREAHQVR